MDGGSAFDDPMPEEILAQNIEIDTTSEFQFMQVMEEHSGPVRALATNNLGQLCSGSLDKSLKLYRQDAADKYKYKFENEIVIHDEFVYDVAAALDDSGFFSTSKDKYIYKIDNQGTPVIQFTGHENVVNSVAQISANKVMSGSWDGTAKIWDVSTGECITTLEGHSYATCVTCLPNGNIATGSQNKKICIWTPEGKKIHDIEAHGDMVRAFDDFSPIGFLSCSNDETIKLWTFEGELIQEHMGH